jgi:hypothetical protein
VRPAGSGVLYYDRGRVIGGSQEVRIDTKATPNLDVQKMWFLKARERIII